ncbi:MAG TPA: phosphatase PAP2 family protein [Methanosarcina sp.]|nr:phosphatase PAP2 family protein [Methanosarcina sp.]
MISSNQLDFMIMLSLMFSVPAGYYIFVPEPLRPKYYYRNLRSSGISEILPYAALAAFIFILMDSQRDISNFLGLSPSLNYDRYMLMLEGTKVSYFQSLANPMLTYFCGVVYLLGFPFLLIFTFILFLFSQNDEALKEYATTFMLIYMVAYVFYIFFPVNVTGYVLPGMIPLLYQLNPAILRIAMICSPGLNNCFPSLHAALSVMATIFILFKTDLRRYKVFAIGTTIFILFSILYLGIHWITDMIGGIILALISYFVATQVFKKRFKDESIHFYMR